MFNADTFLYCFDGATSNDLFEVRREECLVI